MKLRETPSSVRVALVAAPPGPERTAALERRSRTRARGEVLQLGCDRRVGGLWAGVADLVAFWLERARELAPALLEHHAYELRMILPDLRRTLAARTSLTDLAMGDERIRNYSLEWAYRIVHGLNDFVFAAARACNVPGLHLACDSFDEAGALAKRFFAELARRSERRIELTLFLGVLPESAAQEARAWERYRPEVLHLDETGEPEAQLSPAEAAERACCLGEEVAGNPAALERNLFQVIDLWTRAGQPLQALRHQTLALAMLNRYGFYDDALEFAEAVEARLDLLSETGSRQLWAVIGQLFNTHVALGNPRRADRILEREITRGLHTPEIMARAYFWRAMLQVRFLPERNFQLAERHLQDSLEAAAAADIPEQDRQFQMAFSTNGLALVRNRQGRPEEAIRLCQTSLQRIEQHFDPGRHALFRSVLFYNMAQVWVAMEENERAAECFTAAIGLDPGYSEYYNERGNLWLKMGRLQEAIGDYRTAISLSPPYSEVWTNLGQCFRLHEQEREAVQAYDKALDLEPHQLLARLGRAQALRALGEDAAALADYNIALRLDPNQPLVWANRAVLLFEAGRFEEALADLDEALQLDPCNSELLENHAIALAALQERTSPDLSRSLKENCE